MHVGWLGRHAHEPASGQLGSAQHVVCVTPSSEQSNVVAGPPAAHSQAAPESNVSLSQ